MKRVLLGYKITEVDKIIGSLKDENESLHAEIARLKIQIKNNIDSAKSILLEENLKTYEKELLKLKTENNELKIQNEDLTKENLVLKQQLAELQAIINEAAVSNE